MNAQISKECQNFKMLSFRNCLCEQSCQNFKTFGRSVYVTELYFRKILDSFQNQKKHLTTFNRIALYASLCRLVAENEAIAIH